MYKTEEIGANTKTYFIKIWKSCSQSRITETELEN